jgi:hypothetical protein
VEVFGLAGGAVGGGNDPVEYHRVDDVAGLGDGQALRRSLAGLAANLAAAVQSRSTQDR